MEHTNEMHSVKSVLLPFDPIVPILDVVKQWLIIVLISLMAGVGSYCLTDAMYTPVYKTTSTFVVSDRSSSSSVYSNLSTTTGLASVFSELMNSSLLRSAILNEIGEDSFDGTIKAAVIPETNLLTVTVSSSDPRTAFLVAQAVIDHHHTLTYQVVDGVALEVLQNPTVPLAPSNRSNSQSIMKKVMVLTAIASSVFLFFLSYTKNRIRSSTEAIHKLDCSYLGDIPHEQKYRALLSKLRRRKSSILISNPLTSFHFTENIRKLAHRVTQRMHGGKVLMVTSLLENEGKSTVSVNLALAMAQKQAKVLLIDCDLRKPACHLLMERKNLSRGLRDVLTENAKLPDVILQDKKSGLYMLLEPRGSHNAAELLSSEMMRALIKWARREFDFVVLDLPPMAAGSDEEILVEHADASLLVVRQNVAAVPALNKAIASLESGKAKFLGCVLNNVYATSLPFGQDYVGYAGYSKYGHYGRYGAYQSKK